MSTGQSTVTTEETIEKQGKHAVEVCFGGSAYAGTMVKAHGHNERQDGKQRAGGHEDGSGSSRGSARVKSVVEPTDTVHVITVSDRSSRRERADVSGPRAVEILRENTYRVSSCVVPDGKDTVTLAIRAAIASGAHVVITSGGTGIGPRDFTPEGTRPLLTRELTGITEELRRHGASNNRLAVLSRGLAGIVGEGPGALVVNLPGSVRAVEEGLEVLLPLIPHILDQLRGGDH